MFLSKIKLPGPGNYGLFGVGVNVVISRGPALYLIYYYLS